MRTKSSRIYSIQRQIGHPTTNRRDPRSHCTVIKEHGWEDFCGPSKCAGFSLNAEMPTLFGRAKPCTEVWGPRFATIVKQMVGRNYNLHPTTKGQVPPLSIDHGNGAVAQDTTFERMYPIVQKIKHTSRRVRNCRPVCYHKGLGSAERIWRRMRAACKTVGWSSRPKEGERKGARRHRQENSIGCSW